MSLSSVLSNEFSFAVHTLAKDKNASINNMMNTLWVTLIILFFSKVVSWIVSHDIWTTLAKKFTRNLYKSAITLETCIDDVSREAIISDRFIAMMHWLELEIEKSTVPCKSLRELVNTYNDTGSLPFVIEDSEKVCVSKTKDVWVTFMTEKSPSKQNRVSKIVCTFYSFTMTVYELKDFIDQITEEEKRKKEALLDKGPMIFEYMCSKSKFNFAKLGTSRTFESVFFPQKDAFVSEIMDFQNGKMRYESLHIPYHKGILLYGEPGCGKTSIIKAMANVLGRHVISIPLSRVKTNEELARCFLKVSFRLIDIPMERRLYVFEDIDCMKVNKNVTESRILDKDELNDPITLSYLLNLLDGIWEMPGRMIVFTTNHVETLDKALIRPGRIDIKICLEKATKKCIISMLRWNFKKDVPENCNIPEKKWTPAEIHGFIANSATIEDAVNKINQKLD